MRARPLVWFLISVACFVGAFYFWRLAEQWRKEKAEQQNAAPAGQSVESSKPQSFIQRGSSAPGFLLDRRTGTNGAATAAAEAVSVVESNGMEGLEYRLSNTSLVVEELVRSDSAILLENALMDTANGRALEIPEGLRSAGDPGSYIVQARGQIDRSFREAIAQAGGEIISYIPNNAYLVRMNAGQADALRGVSQAVLAYEPYYKLKGDLLKAAVDGEEADEGWDLNVVLFADGREAALESLRELGAEVLKEEPTPFGPGFRVQVLGGNLAGIAQLSGVQLVELAGPRIPANDLSRERTSVAMNSVVETNYLGLTGAGVVVNVNDGGVDASHPDLSPRVFSSQVAALMDTSGHGTHVAGIIAGNGSQWATVTNAYGSILPPTTNQFRGMAPEAAIFSLNADLLGDYELQRQAAGTNALISNNAWNYGGNTYTLASASFDAAVRDALPDQMGSQPVLFVFPAGNNGGGGDNGLGGSANRVQPPGTAKNVITVGSLELLRNITNEVEKCLGPDTNDCVISTPWLGMTDDAHQVAGFSGRGNVGIGVEGEFGRFKPDVVAPGTFVVSTESAQWDKVAYYNPTNYHYHVIDEQVVEVDDMRRYFIFVPDNAVQLQISVFGVNPPIDMPIYVREAGFPSETLFDVLGTNVVNLPPDGPLTVRGTTWFYGIGNPTNEPVEYVIQTLVVTTNDLGNYFTVLSNMNNELGPFYRYESGTSMSAADVSGTLALMQEFFGQQGLTNSPALMKGLLINGARPVASLYDLQVRKTINYQGWGVVNLTNTLPIGISNRYDVAGSLLFFDQSPTNAVATGDRQTIQVSVEEEARTEPLRMTVVWTDPPGNPAAGLKLVNNLDVVVTNLETGQVYFGNDIPTASNFNFAWDTNQAPRLDLVNNVENVYLAPPLGSNYTITVIGRNVNVNAVTAHPEDVAQDYALVVSIGDGQWTNGLTLTSGPFETVNQPAVHVVTNDFVGAADIEGGLLLNERAGAHTPFLGTNSIPLGTTTGWGANGVITLGVTNQWRFYALSNSLGFSNVAFATFLPPNLSPSRMGAAGGDAEEATRVEADIDMYVSTDPALTNLDAAVIGAADKSLGREGTEVIFYTNSVAGDVYYVGVKAEDQAAAEYAFLGLFSEQPFFDQDENGNLTLRGVPVPMPIPDGTPEDPGVGLVVAISPPISVRRVVVTNVVTHEDFGDLFGVLDHNHKSVFLNNHTTGTGQETQVLIYEDNGENNVPFSRQTDGPGSLRDFIGEQGAGVWLISQVDNALGHTGRVDGVGIWLEPQFDTNGIVLTVEPNSFVYNFVDVPVEGTNLTICVGNESANPLPVQLYVRRGDLPTQTIYDYTLTIDPAPPNPDCLSINLSTLPPLQAGRYFIGIYNPNGVAQTVRLRADVDLDLTGVAPIRFNAGGAVPILDDAVTTSTIVITNEQRITQASVGVVIEHERISDLVLTLISPTGKRILLFENRGGPDSANLGAGQVITNVFPQFSDSGGANPNPTTNTVTPVPTVGTLLIDYNFFTLADSIDVYYDGANIFSLPPVSGVGQFSIPYGPGSATELQIVINQNGNTNATTEWQFTASVISQDYAYFTFTENTNSTQMPLKFALPPFAGNSGVTTVSLSSFDVAPANDYLAPTTVEGWSVDNNQVSVVNDAVTAESDPQFLALANGTISRILPTTIGSRYGLTFAYRGPDAISWWPGDGSPIDRIDSNPGVFANGPTYSAGLVGGQAFRLDGIDDQINVGDPANLKLTEAFSIDAWIFPMGYPTLNHGQILFRGDDRGGLDPYYFSLQLNGTLRLHVENGLPGGAFDLQTSVIGLNEWMHVAGVFDGALGQLRIYTNGTLAAQANTAVKPFANLSPGDLPGVAIGNHSYGFNNQGFNGMIDELTIYRRPVSGSEIRAIYAARTAGKFDPAAPIPDALAKASVVLDGTASTLFGNNTNWQTTTLSFTATQSGTPLEIEGLQPGMLLDSVTLSEFTSGDLFYLPEQTLDDLIGDMANGAWTLEIHDTRAGAASGAQLVNWQMQFLFETESPIPTSLTHGVAATNTVPPCGIAYFIVDVPPWAAFATNILEFATAPVNVYFNQAVRPNAITPPDTLLLSGTSGSATLSTNGTPPLVPGARYYLGVENPCGNNTNVTFAIRVDFDITPLTNGIPYDAVAQDNLLPRYFVYDVSTNATAAWFQLYNLSGNVNLIARKGLPLPTLDEFDYGSFNLGTSSEEILVFTNSTPVALAPGPWYLAVYNFDAVPNTYTILATEFTNALPNIIPLTNGVPYANSNSPAAGEADYYRYTVSGNAARVQFEINNPSDDVTLVARKDLPLPDLTLFDYISANAFTNDELIVVFTNSTPVPLSAGNWFLSAVNVSGMPVTYSIKATEWAETGVPIAITNVQVTPPSGTNAGSFCITWTSLPGAHYYVEAVPTLNDTNWVTISPTITAVDYTTTFCVALPSPFHFFRVRDGLPQDSYVPSPVIGIQYTAGGILLEWYGPLSAQYQVQWTPSLSLGTWNTIPTIITSTNGLFSFLDDGSLTGGLDDMRMYRVQQAP